MRRFSECDRFLFSPSDLNNFFACKHLTQLEIGVALGESVRPSFGNAYVELINRKGQEHELHFLDAVRAGGHALTQIGHGDDQDFQVAAKNTVEAMHTGFQYIYQAAFLDSGWRGIADFLERVDRSSGLGAWSYVVLDTKLARHPRPEHALQLYFYTLCLAQIQGLEPELAYVILGTRERLPIRLGDVSAFYRRLRSRFEAAVGARTPTAPYPCEHCAICDFQQVCADQWEREDHLVRVAGIRHDQIDRLLSPALPWWLLLSLFGH